jgi:hypothetical protein
VTLAPALGSTPVAPRGLRHLPMKEKSALCGAFQRADEEARTPDPQLGKLMLYQLSYVRVPRL